MDQTLFEKGLAKRKATLGPLRRPSKDSGTTCRLACQGGPPRTHWVSSHRRYSLPEKRDKTFLGQQCGTKTTMLLRRNRPLPQRCSSSSIPLRACAR